MRVTERSQLPFNSDVAFPFSLQLPSSIGIIKRDFPDFFRLLNDEDYVRPAWLEGDKRKDM